MYSAATVMQRRCVGARKDGQPCNAWALWDDPRQLCLVHAGRSHMGPLGSLRARHQRARYEPCLCDAYAWPHRPGGGLCRWPEEPEYVLTTTPGTHRWPRLRKRRRRLLLD